MGTVTNILSKEQVLLAYNLVKQHENSMKQKIKNEHTVDEIKQLLISNGWSKGNARFIIQPIKKTLKGEGDFFTLYGKNFEEIAILKIIFAQIIMDYGKVGLNMVLITLDSTIKHNKEKIEFDVTFLKKLRQELLEQF